MKSGVASLNVMEFDLLPSFLPRPDENIETFKRLNNFKDMVQVDIERHNAKACRSGHNIILYPTSLRS
jgi:hypothetical protein